MTIIVFLIILMLTGYDLSRVKRDEAKHSHFFESWAIILISGLTLGYFISDTTFMLYTAIYDIIEDITGIEGVELHHADTSGYGVLVWACILLYVATILYLKYKECREEKEKERVAEGKRTFIYLYLAYMNMKKEPLKLAYRGKEVAEDEEVEEA